MTRGKTMGNLTSRITRKLKKRAKRHRRSQEKAKTGISLSMEEARQLAEQWQQRLAGQIQGDSSELLREDREGS
jgi:hypothetical protein